MRAAHGFQGVDGDGEGPVRGVLDADGRSQSRGQLAVGLGLGGARADGGPGDEILEVAGRHRVQRLGGHGNPSAGDVEQQPPGPTDALFDVEAVVQVRVVDQALPAERRTRLLEVGAHHEVERVAGLAGQGAQSPGVVHGRLGVVDRAGPDHHEQTVVTTRQDVLDASSGTGDEGECLGRRRIPCLDLGRCGQCPVRGDVRVLGCGNHCSCPPKKNPDDCRRSGFLRRATDGALDIRDAYR